MTGELMPLASLEDLQAIWKPLTEEEQTKATTLLDMVSAKLRVLAFGQNKNIDEMLAEDTTGTYAKVVKLVVCEAVKRSMNRPVDALPVENYSQTAGPYSENYRYTNPDGNIYFRKEELKSIGLYNNQIIDSISPMTRGGIYGN